MDVTIKTFEEAVEYAMAQIGEDFEKALQLCNAILDKPQDYTGPQAAMTAIKLSAYRLKIGVAAQHFKNSSVGSSDRHIKWIKDALMTAFTGLEELINTLKITARHDHEIVRS